MGKEIRSSNSPILLPPSAFAVTRAWPAHLLCHCHIWTEIPHVFWHAQCKLASTQIWSPPGHGGRERTGPSAQG